MGCLKLEDNNQYKGEKIKMPRRNRSAQNASNLQGTVLNPVQPEDAVQSGQNNSGTSNEALYAVPRIVIRILACVGGAAFTILIAFLAWVGVQVVDLKAVVAVNDNNIDKITDDVSDINDEIASINNEIADIKQFLYGKNGVDRQLEDINGVLHIVPTSAASNPNAAVDEASIEKKDVAMSGASYEADTIVGTDANGNVYIAKEHINEKLLLTYEEEGKEIYFLGQYNENYHWDGYCVTNAYFLDGTLYGICESNFEDGKRLDYESFYRSDKPGEWIHVSKDSEKSDDIKTSIRYGLTFDKVKNFTTTNVRVTDILYVNSFIDVVDLKMLSYYCGKTAKGVYNDETGNAYEAIFNSDGTVKTLYVGNFVKGTFKDNDAWDIAYSEEGDFYVYNTGKFENGGAKEKSITPLSLEDIREIISNYEFGCDLEWKMSAFGSEPMD